MYSRWYSRGSTLPFAGLLAFTAAEQAGAMGLQARADAQPPITVVRSTPACSGCVLEFIKVATVASTASDAVLPAVGPLARNSSGLFFSASSTRDQVVVYDSAGRYRTAFGRAGTGPGESGRINDVKVGAGDSIWVFQGNRVFHVFSPALQFVRSGRLPASMNTAAPLPGGKLLYTSTIGTEPAAGYPVHILRPDGSIERSLGRSSLVIDPRCQECMYRIVAPARDSGKIWVVWRNRYRIERWTVQGALELVIERDAPWFPPRLVDPPGFGQPIAVGPVVAAGTPPSVLEPQRSISELPPFPVRITEDDAGLIWVSLSGITNGETIRRLEVIDPVRGELMAAGELPEHITSFWEGGFGVGPGAADSDFTSFDIWKLTVKRTEQQLWEMTL